MSLRLQIGFVQDSAMLRVNCRIKVTVGLTVVILVSEYSGTTEKLPVTINATIELQNITTASHNTDTLVSCNIRR